MGYDVDIVPWFYGFWLPFWYLQTFLKVCRVSHYHSTSHTVPTHSEFELWVWQIVNIVRNRSNFDNAVSIVFFTKDTVHQNNKRIIKKNIYNAIRTRRLQINVREYRRDNQKEESREIGNIVGLEGSVYSA